ncbi:Adiponutrin and related vesicular transport protein [Ostreococcus tauri]|uniref:Patatin n=1 Tax=Ostreococcus tauri TaxID=70448 RepID=A0A1Y5IE97_OSTTA|nr:Adiponutrin and related vesicular transport protein [Ostreococcus tauri]
MRHGRASASTDEPTARATTDEPAGTSGDAGRFEYEIALGSSGWLFVYYVGVVKALRERGMARCEGKTKVYGTSGGALSGALLFMDCDLDALAQYVYICAARARRSVLGAFQLRAYCRGAMTEFCDPRAHELLSGRLQVSITRIFPSYKNLRISDYPSYDFLITALLCSACIVPLSGLPIWLRGFGLCLDGAVSDMQVWKGFKPDGTFSKLHCKAANPNIVIVNPFYSSRADIKPSKYIPIWWCFYPPEPYKLKQLYEMGYKDANAWYERTHGLSKSSASPSARESDVDTGSPIAEQQRSWATELVLKVVACLLVYSELVIQSLIALAGATVAAIPLPRVLLQAVPGIKLEAKINEKTAKQLGELSALYRLLCYLVHMNEREFDVLRKRLSASRGLNELDHTVE